MSQKQRNKIEYIVACVSEFAGRFSLSVRQSFDYLYHYKGIQALDMVYEAEHLFSMDDAIDDLVAVCYRNGGHLR